MPASSMATVGSSVIGAGASLFGASEQAKASKQAANVQLALGTQALTQQANSAIDQRNYLQPYVQSGNNAVTDLNNTKFGAGVGWANGVSTPDSVGLPIAPGSVAFPSLYNKTAAPSTSSYIDMPAMYGKTALPNTPGAFALPDAVSVPNLSQTELMATPGYQFSLAQGLKAAQNSAAAKGLGLSGAAIKAASNYATGLSDSTYATRYNELLQKAGLDFGQNQTRFQDAYTQGQGLFTNDLQRASTDISQNQGMYDRSLSARNADIAQRNMLYGQSLQNAQFNVAQDQGLYDRGVTGTNAQFAQNQSIFGDQINLSQADIAQRQQLYADSVNNQSNIYSRLFGVAGLGQSSAAGVGAGMLSTGQNSANTFTSIGNALGASAISQGNAYSGAASNIGQMIQLNQLLGRYGSGSTIGNRLTSATGGGSNIFYDENGVPWQ